MSTVIQQNLRDTPQPRVANLLCSLIPEECADLVPELQPPLIHHANEVPQTPGTKPHPVQQIFRRPEIHLDLVETVNLSANLIQLFSILDVGHFKLFSLWKP